MRKVLWVASAFVVMAGMANVAVAAQRMDECHRVASECMQAGGDKKQCQAQVDECMSRNACEEVYLSCLELMEIDETVTEAACTRKRATCRRSRGEKP